MVAEDREERKNIRGTTDDQLIDELHRPAERNLMFRDLPGRAEDPSCSTAPSRRTRLAGDTYKTWGTPDSGIWMRCSKRFNSSFSRRASKKQRRPMPKTTTSDTHSSAKYAVPHPGPYRSVATLCSWRSWPIL